MSKLGKRALLIGIFYLALFLFGGAVEGVEKIGIVDPPPEPGENSSWPCSDASGPGTGGTIVLFGDPAAMSHLPSTYDPQDCAALSLVWPDEALGRPLEPTALELATIQAQAEPDPLTRWGLTAVFAIFLLISAGWLWMLNGQKPKPLA